jgi:hypothetical protein
MSDEELFAVKGGVSVEGANLEVRAGRSFPRFLARMFPRAAARRDATSLIASSILDKIARREALDASDVAYAREILGEPESKWIRRQQIAAKTMKVVEALPKLALPPIEDAGTGAPSGDSGKTADDWINKFWDDAGLVADEMLQEIYARILAQESIAPGSCSMRTLLALRYLDHKTANLFAMIAPYVMGYEWIPNDLDLLTRFGVTHGQLLELDDAGLINSDSIKTLTLSTDLSFIRWGGRALMLNKAKDLTFPAYLLRSPGRELARVAQVDQNPAYFFRVANWLKSKRTDLELAWAELPFPRWVGSTEALQWMQVPPPDAPG